VVGEVDPRRSDRNTHLPRAGRRRIRTFLQLKDRQVTVLCDYDRAHANSPFMK
jgi:hypothetical protein